MKLAQESLSNYFTVINTGHCVGVDVNPRCTFDFVSRESSSLVVTVGDSWTWGSDLTNDNNEDFRRNSVYGNLISHALQCDWLNLGQGGSGNRWLCQRVAELVKILPNLDYDTVYLICTLTEIGRASNSIQYTHVDYTQFFKNNGFENLLYHVNEHTVSELIQLVAGIPSLKLIIGTNFVDHLGLEKAYAYLLPKTWLELCCEAENLDLNNPCYIVSPWVLDELKQLKPLVPEHRHLEYLNWIDTLLDPAISRLNLLGEMKLMNNFHPTAAGHQLWANYILKYIYDTSANQP